MSGFPLKKTGIASRAALLLISLTIKNTIIKPDVNPNERITVSNMLLEILRHIKTAIAVKPPGKLKKLSFSISFFIKYLIIKY